MNELLVKEIIINFKKFCNTDRCSCEDCEYHEPFDNKLECIAAFTIEYIHKGDGLDE